MSLSDDSNNTLINPQAGTPSSINTKNCNDMNTEDSENNTVLDKQRSAQDDTNFSEMSLPHEIIFVLIIVLGQFVTLCGATQGIPMMGAVGKTFKLKGAEVLDLGWDNAGFAATVGSFVIIAGKLGDINGHKNMFCLGYGWLALWSLLAGFSRYCSDPVFFFFCRGAQGIGAAFLFPSGLALLGKTYPTGRRKNFVFSLYGYCVPLGAIMGLTFSSLFTQLAHWSWTYWAMGIACSVLTALSIIFLPKDEVAKRERSALKDFDYLGGFCGISGLILFSIVLNQTPNKGGFKITYIYILLIVSVVLMALAFIIDIKVKDPLLPWTHICAGTLKALICILFGFFSFVVWLFFTWNYYLSARHDTLLLAAAKFAPLTVAGLFAAGFSLLLLNAEVPVQIRLLAASCAFLISNILLATYTRGEPYWAAPFISTLIISIALDVSFPSAMLLLSNGVPPELQGICGSLVGAMLNYGTALGPGVATTVITYQRPKALGASGEEYMPALHVAGYVGIGASGFGVLTALYGCVSEYYKERKNPECKQYRGKKIII